MNAFQALIEVVKRLRSPDGCPWDRKQTFNSLTQYIIEEAYELVQAIETNQAEAIKEELGDVLLHVVMISLMAEEEGHFKLEEVIQTITQKMKRRHPHVFGTTNVSSVDDVLKNWDAIKKTEGKHNLLKNIPAHMPALLQSALIQKRVARVGFDWNDYLGPLDKITEEVKELKQAAESKDSEAHITEEIGDILFAVVNVARKLKIDPEKALRLSNRKFMARFNKMETTAKKKKKPLQKHSLPELEALWHQAKREEKL